MDWYEQSRQQLQLWSFIEKDRASWFYRFLVILKLLWAICFKFNTLFRLFLKLPNQKEPSDINERGEPIARLHMKRLILRNDSVDVQETLGKLSIILEGSMEYT